MKSTLLTDEEAKTIDYYDKFAIEWSDKHSGGTMFSPEMQIMFKLYPQGNVLEIGAGHGEDAKKLIRHYGVENYIGCEPARGLIRIARKNNPKGKFENITVYELEKLNMQFDVFWISAMIIHIPKKRIKEVLSIIHRVIKKGGVGFISIMEGDIDMGESRHGRHYSLWSQKEFEQALTSTSFETLKKRKIVTKASPWLTYLLKVI